MGLICNILVTVVCLLLSFLSFRIGKRKQEYETDVDTLENERRYNAKVMGHFCGVMFLLPLVSCWFPKWANVHNWNLIYAGFLLLVMIFIVFPKIRDDEDDEEMKKRSNNHNDYKSVR